MLESTWAGRKLNGYRSLPPADQGAVQQALLRFSHLAADFPELAEIEINPLRALGVGQGALLYRCCAPDLRMPGYDLTLVRVFAIIPEILSSFPNICGGVILLAGFSLIGLLRLHCWRPILRSNSTFVRTARRSTSQRNPLACCLAIGFRQFGVDPTKYRCAAEALLRRLTKKGDIPSINTLVDLCNLISIRFALPVAAFDARSLSRSDCSPICRR